ncbi:MAG: antitoxin [Spirochaetes bacterium]|nr:antitoxin [Spirochaetota bacterium]
MNYKLDDEEKDILDSYQKGEWKSISNMNNEIKKHIEYARATIKKDKRVNIRISERDLESIQMIAIEEGIPYQTLISSLLHKYISGKLVERERTIYNNH